MLTSTLYRYFYILFFIKYIQICSSIYSTKMADTRLWRSSFVAFVWGLRQAARIMRKIISYCRGRRRNWETGKANALDFRLAASWACFLLCVPIAIPLTHSHSHRVVHSSSYSSVQFQFQFRFR